MSSVTETFEETGQMTAFRFRAAVRSILRVAPVLPVAMLALGAISCGSDDCLPASISSLSPNEATAGGPDFTVSVVGENFGSNTVLLWNGASRTTTVVNATHLTALIPASDIANPGTVQIKISNQFQSAGSFFICAGGDSKSLAFTINP